MFIRVLNMVLMGNRKRFSGNSVHFLRKCLLQSSCFTEFARCIRIALVIKEASWDDFFSEIYSIFQKQLILGGFRVATSAN